MLAQAAVKALQLTMTVQIPSKLSRPIMLAESLLKVSFLMCWRRRCLRCRGRANCIAVRELCDGFPAD